MNSDQLQEIRTRQSRYRKVPMVPLWFKLSRWPWHIRTSIGLLDVVNRAGDLYGWKHTGGMGRFGGGWQWKLGIQKGGSSVICDLIWGSIHFTWKDPKIAAAERKASTEELDKILKEREEREGKKKIEQVRRIKTVWR